MNSWFQSTLWFLGYSTKNSLHIWGAEFGKQESLITTSLMMLPEWAHIITLRWYALSVLWLSWSVKTSPVDLFCSAWVGLCVQLQAEGKWLNLFLDDKAFLPPIIPPPTHTHTFPLIYQGEKKRNWLILLILTFGLFPSLSFFPFPVP